MPSPIKEKEEVTVISENDLVDVSFFELRT